MNDTIFFFLYNLTHKSEIFDKIIIFFAVYFLYILIISAMISLLFHHKILSSKSSLREFINKWQDFILLFTSGGLAWSFAKILKILIHTERPFDLFPQVNPLFIETGYAFPSGHTAVASAIAFALFFTHKKVGYIFIFFAILIGLARIVAGVHFPIDILGGFIVGIIIAYLVALFAKNI